MAGQNEALLKKLLEVFAIEAQEHLDAVSASLLALERAPAPERGQELVEVAFREVHSLKGAARAVNLGSVVTLCHALESVFDALKVGRRLPSAGVLDLLHEGFSAVKDILPRDRNAAMADPRPEVEALRANLDAVAKTLRRGETGGDPAGEAPRDRRSGAALAAPASMDAQLPGSPQPTVRVSTAKLDALLHQAEELIAAKLAAARLAGEIEHLAGELIADGKRRERGRRRVNARRVGRGARMNGGGAAWLGDADAADLREQIEQADQTFRSLSAKMTLAASAARHDLRALDRAVDNLIEGAKQVLMAPFSTLLDPLPQLVRDLSRRQGKDAELIIRGEEIEIDRRIQEEMKDAVMHLVRNAIDHGIETPAERARKGKPGRGTVTIAITQQGSSRAEIAISDDGAGVNVATVRRAVQQMGVASAEQAAAMDDAALLSNIFRSGVSTSPSLTEVSGRGLGLAIVQEKVERLGGTIAVATRGAAGTDFRIVLPVALASFRGVIVEVDGAPYILPSGAVDRVIRVTRDEITSIEGGPTVQIAGRAIALVQLRNVLGLTAKDASTASHLSVIVLMSAGIRVGFVVDAIRDEQEVLMRGLGRQLARVRNVAGATVLPTGAIAFILDVRDLMKSAAAAAGPRRQIPRPTPPIARRKDILVVEDSITARTLFKHVLETAGYRVKTAVDGLEAWTNLQTDAFDLVVSDVEMPRLNGFDLTIRIRKDAKLRELPVILVTSRGSREDREQGMDAGASSYIVKDRFDQNHLLDIVSRLI